MRALTSRAAVWTVHREAVPFGLLQEEEAAARAMLLAIGQIVFSLTARPGVGRVAFTLAGDRVEVPRGDGSLTSGSVSRDAYLTLLTTGTPRPSAAGSTARPGGSVAGMVTGRR